MMEVFMNLDFESVAAVIGSVLVAAKAVLVAADKIAGLTPSNSDDEALAGVRKVFAKVVQLADRLSLNPDNVKARKGKESSND